MKIKVNGSNVPELTPCKINIEVTPYGYVFISCPGYNTEEYECKSAKGVANALEDYLLNNINMN